MVKSYFFKLEQDRQQNNLIEKLDNVRVDKYVYNNNEIIGQLCNFYENLYTSKSPLKEKNSL